MSIKKRSNISPQELDNKKKLTIFCFNKVCEKCKRIKEVKWNSVRQTKEDRKSFVQKKLFPFMAMMNFLEYVLEKNNAFLLIKSTVEGIIFISMFY